MNDKTTLGDSFYCSLCGDRWYNQPNSIGHFCRQIAPTHIPPPLTEEDIRRIFREEIKKKNLKRRLAATEVVVCALRLMKNKNENEFFL